MISEGIYVVFKIQKATTVDRGELTYVQASEVQTKFQTACFRATSD